MSLALNKSIRSTVFERIDAIAPKVPGIEERTPKRETNKKWLTIGLPLGGVAAAGTIVCVMAVAGVFRANSPSVGTFMSQNSFSTYAEFAAEIERQNEYSEEPGLFLADPANAVAGAYTYVVIGTDCCASEGISCWETSEKTGHYLKNREAYAICDTGYKDASSGLECRFTLQFMREFDLGSAALEWTDWDDEHPDGYEYGGYVVSFRDPGDQVWQLAQGDLNAPLALLVLEGQNDDPDGQSEEVETKFKEIRERISELFAGAYMKGE
jgi:hypothetical protein